MNNNPKQNKFRSLILQYFSTISSGQNVLQCIKQALFLHQNFNPLILFDMISHDRQQITRHDWRLYLQSNSIAFEDGELGYMFTHHNFGNLITFNQFLQAMIPHNADVLRIFKRNYLNNIEIRRLDPQVQFMFRQLNKFWVDLFRNIIKIKKQIQQIGGKAQVEQLMKSDLIYENKGRLKVREAVKFRQAFQNNQFQLGYHQLRKFLELWQTDKNIQLQLLQIKRHFRNYNPFHKICIDWGKDRSRRKSKSFSPQKARSRSKSTSRLQKNKQVVFSTQQKQQKPKNQQFTPSSQHKYNHFQTELFNDLKKYKNQPTNSRSNPRFSLNGGKQKQTQHHQQENNGDREGVGKENYLRSVRYRRDKKGINGEYIVQMLSLLLSKEKILEKLRKKLANNNNFNLINLFKLIDYNNRGYVNSKLIEEFIKKQVDCDLLVQHYERQKGKLRFQDFCMIYRPLSKKLNQILDHRPEHKVPNPFKRQTMQNLTQILIQSSNLFNSMYSLKQQINNSGIKPITLFKYIDLQDKGYIAATDFKDLLDEKNISCQQTDLKFVMKYFGKRVQQTIGYGEFQGFVDL